VHNYTYSIYEFLAMENIKNASGVLYRSGERFVQF